MNSLTQEELLRYQRQLIIPELGEEGQLRLKRAAVIVIGAGGLGSPLLLYLAGAGVGRIGIVDHDEVSISNLQRQILYTTDDITRAKATVAAERLSRLNPSIEVAAMPVRLIEENAASLLTGYDIAVDCTDNFHTRYIISDATLRAGIPMVYGAVTGFMGQVSVFNYRGGPSYRDLYPEEIHGRPESMTEDRDKTGQERTAREKTGLERAGHERTARERAGQERAGLEREGEPLGVIGPLPGIISSVQACEVIKLITGAGEILSGRLLQIDALNLRNSYISI